MSSLIPADQTFAVLAALFAIALFGFWAETKPWGKMLTGAIWSILGAVIASNLHIIPHQAPAYHVVFHYFVPMLLPLFLLQANIKRIIAESGRVGIAFILACMGTVAGVLLGSHLVNLGTKANILAGMFTATYTGGSANFAAVVQSTGFNDANAIAASTAVDNLLGVLFLMLLVAMPACNWLVKHFVDRDHPMDENNTLDSTDNHVSGYSLAAALTYTLSVVALSDGIVHLLNSVSSHTDFSSLRYLLITLFSVLAATFAPRQLQKMHGAQSIGLVFALVFFATIAADADVATLLAYAPVLLVFVLIVLTVHWLVVFGGGALLTKLFKRMGKEQQLGLSMPELIIASNAAIIGATTAPALAMARGWGTLVTPGILVGVAGYIIGTPLGLLMVAWW